MLKKLILKNKLVAALIGFLILSFPAFSISPVTSWMTDMWNQISIKPQEDGSMMAYPLDSVTTEGILVTSDGMNNPYASSASWVLYRNDQSLAPVNPVAKKSDSIKNGRYLYDVYCAVCHGGDGMAQTPVGKMRGAPPISILMGGDPTLAEGYLYSKIQFGGLSVAGMPPFGYQTTAKERWDIVNFITDKWSPK